MALHRDVRGLWLEKVDLIHLVLARGKASTTIKVVPVKDTNTDIKPFGLSL